MACTGKAGLLRDENAQSLVEYVLVTGLTVIGLVASIEFIVVGDDDMRIVQSALRHVYRFSANLVTLPIP